MSGVDIVGVVASIVQIAELGRCLSVKLCTFCHKFKIADKAQRYLSKDVALTCNVLCQLGDSLGQDELASLYSPDAFETAQVVLRECEQVFGDLEAAIEQHSPDPLSQSSIDEVARKFKFMMNETYLDTVAGNLDRLRSTMLLMLNVAIYAGQIRSQRETHELQEQRHQLLVLTSEKIESEKDYERLTRTLEFTSLAEKGGNVRSPTGGNQPDQPDETTDELYHDHKTPTQPPQMLQAQAMQRQMQSQPQSQEQSIPATEKVSMAQMRVYEVLRNPQQRRQMMRDIFQSEPEMQEPPVLPSQHSVNLNNSNQPFNQPPDQPNSLNHGQPDPPPPYSPLMQAQSRATEAGMPSKTDSFSGTPPVAMDKSAESGAKQVSPNPGVPEKPKAFELDFSLLDDPSFMEKFDFDQFLRDDDDDDDDTSSSKNDLNQLMSDIFSREATSLQDEENEHLSSQHTPRDSSNPSPKGKSEKRKAKTEYGITPANDNSEPLPNSESMSEEGRSKTIPRDPSTWSDELSWSTVGPPIANAGAETGALSSAATEDQSLTSKDAENECLDAWILRWTKLEQTELK